jgi:hypothetical protein
MLTLMIFGVLRSTLQGRHDLVHRDRDRVAQVRAAGVGFRFKNSVLDLVTVFERACLTRPRVTKAGGHTSGAHNRCP